jgi:hypothetical protein
MVTMTRTNITTTTMMLMTTPTAMTHRSASWGYCGGHWMSLQARIGMLDFRRIMGWCILDL